MLSRSRTQFIQSSAAPAVLWVFKCFVALSLTPRSRFVAWQTSLEKAVIWMLCAEHWKDSQIMIKARSKSYVVTLAGKNARRLMIISLLIDHKILLAPGKAKVGQQFSDGARSLHGSCREFVSSELLHAHSVTTQKQEFRSSYYALRPPSTFLFCCR